MNLEHVSEPCGRCENAKNAKLANDGTGGLKPVLETRPSLLVRVRDGSDHAAWSQFVSLYAPLIHAYGRRRGLQDADAADLVQDVMQAAARNLAEFEYDATKGSFRGWLFTVTRNKFLNWATRSKKQPRGSGDTAVCQLLKEHPDADREYWDQQHKWRLVRWASDQVSSEFHKNTWLAFQQTAFDQKPVVEVAAALGISVGAVYIAKSRVLARIREVINDAEGD